MRKIPRCLILAVLTGVLGACDVLLPEKTKALRSVERVFVVSQAPLDEPFIPSRQHPTVYERVDVLIPHSHRLGQIEWPGSLFKIDPFTVTNHVVFNDSGLFNAAVSNRASATETLVFVHGYNTSTAEAVLRLAQIKSDFQQTNTPSVAFAWPSASDPLAYAHDRDSVLYARDDLVELLDGLARGNERNIAIIGHSMGALLTMEALRQIALENRDQLAKRITWLALVSPDIDPDVFRSQFSRIRHLPQEFYVLTAKQDRALSLSSLIVGGRRRLGLIESAALADLGVTILNLSAFAEGIAGNHGLGFKSPAAIAALMQLEGATSSKNDG